MESLLLLRPLTEAPDCWRILINQFAKHYPELTAQWKWGINRLQTDMAIVCQYQDRSCSFIIDPNYETNLIRMGRNPLEEFIAIFSIWLNQE